ncbi:hypothetical protein PGTUg99_017768 [Puccinia graminis f. sp. tritici]|uniref:Uncharacterized protein n=1 Tax=Puccinia graminis f. sp. tritici TaxID=56615 RepID=A0A5B0RZH1_PUCGR|nr:hypothetical protein PGTUg99_017768 [Puccinia graminis f. sp. tritici]
MLPLWANINLGINLDDHYTQSNDVTDPIPGSVFIGDRIEMSANTVYRDQIVFSNPIPIYQMIGISWGDSIRAAWELGIGIAQADPRFPRSFRLPVLHIPTTPSLPTPPPPHRSSSPRLESDDRPPPLVASPINRWVGLGLEQTSPGLPHLSLKFPACPPSALSVLNLTTPPPPRRFIVHQTLGRTRTQSDTARPPPLVVPGPCPPLRRWILNLATPPSSLHPSNVGSYSDSNGHRPASATCRSRPALRFVGVLPEEPQPQPLLLLLESWARLGIRPRPLSFVSLVVQDS